MAAGGGWAGVAWRPGAGGGVGGRPGGARRLAGGGSQREARVDGARRAAKLGGLSAVGGWRSVVGGVSATCGRAG